MESADFLLVIIDHLFFASCHGWGTIKQNLSKSSLSERVHGVNLRSNFR